MKKKRKLRIFPFICIAVVLAVAIYAVNLLSDFFDGGEKEKEPIIDNLSENKEEDKNDSVVVPPRDDPEDTPPVIPDLPKDEIPDEDETEFTPEAPKPLYTQAELLDMFGETVLDISEDAGQGYIDEIIFIGDSTTHGMAYYGVLNGGKETTQVWTPKSGTLAMWGLLTENIVYPDDDSEMLIPDAIEIKEPDKVVLTLGVNGVSSLSEKDFKKYYNELIEAIKDSSPNTQIILQSIYPVCDYYEIKSISMEKINRANFWIAQIAHDNGVYYLNTATALVGENGYLRNEYCNGDGIHISREGFGVILKYIREHAIQ